MGGISLAPTPCHAHTGKNSHPYRPLTVSLLRRTIIASLLRRRAPIPALLGRRRHVSALLLRRRRPSRSLMLSLPPLRSLLLMSLRTSAALALHGLYVRSLLERLVEAADMAGDVLVALDRKWDNGLTCVLATRPYYPVRITILSNG